MGVRYRSLLVDDNGSVHAQVRGTVSPAFKGTHANTQHTCACIRREAAEWLLRRGRNTAARGSTAAAAASEAQAALYGVLLLQKLAVSHQKHFTVKKGLGF